MGQGSGERLGDVTRKLNKLRKQGIVTKITRTTNGYYAVTAKVDGKVEVLTFATKGGRHVIGAYTKKLRKAFGQQWDTL